MAQNNPLDQYSCTKKLNVKWGYDLHVWLMKRSSWKWQWNWMQVNTLLLREISDVFKSFQNGLTNSWAIFLSTKTSYGKIVHSPSEILIGVKQEGQKAARKRLRPRTCEKSTLWWERDSNWQHIGTFLYPSDNDIAPCQTKSDSEKSEGGGVMKRWDESGRYAGGKIEAEIAILLVIIFLQMMCVHVCACSGLSSPHCCECYRQCCVQCCWVTELKYTFPGVTAV